MLSKRVVEDVKKATVDTLKKVKMPVDKKEEHLAEVEKILNELDK